MPFHYLLYYVFTISCIGLTYFGLWWVFTAIPALIMQSIYDDWRGVPLVLSFIIGGVLWLITIYFTRHMPKKFYLFMKAKLGFKFNDEK